MPRVRKKTTRSLGSVPGPRSGIVPEINLDDRPLLDHAAELRLGRRIQSGLRRLRILINRHPAGYRKVAERLLGASRGEFRVVTWGSDRNRFREDHERAAEHLGEFERKGASLKRRQHSYLEGARILDRYPLEPELAVRVGLDLGRRSPASRDRGCVAKLERLLSRLADRILESRDELTRANERLVLREALKYRPRGLRESDLYQEGFMGLQRAAMRFDPARNLRFSTYGTFWVRQAIRQSLVNQSRLIRVPQRTQLLLRKHQAGAKTRLDAAEAERVSRVMHRTVTFSFAQDDDESTTDFDRNLWQKGPSFAPGTLPTLIEEGLKRLCERQRRIVERRFGLDGRPSQTLESIGHDMQLSRERVRQLEREAIRKLRRHREFEDAYEGVLSAG